MATYTVDLFMTLDGFGSGPVGYWGKGGPELEERQARVFFGGEQETLVLGAGTYRLMAGFAAERGHDPASTRSPRATRSSSPGRSMSRWTGLTRHSSPRTRSTP
jgi:hypothetical protein